MYEDECKCVMNFRAPQVSEKLEFSLQSYNDTELLDARTFHLGNTEGRGSNDTNAHVLAVF